SVTRSRMIGKVFIGRTEIGLPGSKCSMRDLHMSAGLPFTSALHEPHLAALQFQRTARSGAWCAWIQWIASSTTIPGSTGAWYSPAPGGRPVLLELLERFLRCLLGAAGPDRFVHDLMGRVVHIGRAFAARALEGRYQFLRFGRDIGPRDARPVSREPAGVG